VASAHQGAVALITEDIEDLENVSLVDGEVRWNILPAVTMAIAYLFDAGSLPPIIEPVEVPEATYDEPPGEGIIALGEALGERLPDDFGVVTIMSADQLRSWQSIARFLDRAFYGAIFLTLLLVVAALTVAADRRRTVVQIALGSVVAVLVAWIVQRNVLAAVDAAIGAPGQQAAVEVLFEAVFGSLRSISLIYIVVAGVVGVAAHIAGRPRWMMALRNFGQSDRDNESRPIRLDDVIGRHRDAFIVAGLPVAVGIWWWVGISLASVVVVGAALGTYLWYVTRVAAPAVEGSKVQAATRRNRR
jgi:hypothetical protein